MTDRPTILLASENIIFVTYISILLNRMGFEVLPAESGMEVLHVLKLVESDIVIFDANVANVEALRGIRDSSDLLMIPVIMIADRMGNKVFDQCLEIGCSAFLTKPVTVNELYRALQKNYSYRSGSQRRFLRAAFDRKVKITMGGETREYYAVTLSERGIYIRSKEDIPVDTAVEVSFTVGDSEFSARGRVIYRKGVYGELFRIAPGIAVFFEDLSDKTAKMLNECVTELLVSDIIEEQEEEIITLSKEEEEL
jgi:CheY-like chemotaxis protein